MRKTGDVLDMRPSAGRVVEEMGRKMRKRAMSTKRTTYWQVRQQFPSKVGRWRADRR